MLLRLRRLLVLLLSYTTTNPHYHTQYPVLGMIRLQRWAPFISWKDRGKPEQNYLGEKYQNKRLDDRIGQTWVLRSQTSGTEPAIQRSGASTASWWIKQLRRLKKNRIYQMLVTVTACRSLGRVRETNNLARVEKRLLRPNSSFSPARPSRSRRNGRRGRLRTGCSGPDGEIGTLLRSRSAGRRLGV